MGGIQHGEGAPAEGEGLGGGEVENGKRKTGPQSLSLPLLPSPFPCRAPNKEPPKRPGIIKSPPWGGGLSVLSGWGNGSQQAGWIVSVCGQKFHDQTFYLFDFPDPLHIYVVRLIMEIRRQKEDQIGDRRARKPSHVSTTSQK